MKTNTPEQYIKSNIAHILKNADRRNLSFKELCDTTGERLEYLDKPMKKEALTALLMVCVQNSRIIFRDASNLQTDLEIIQEFKELSKKTNYSFKN